MRQVRMGAILDVIAFLADLCTYDPGRSRDRKSNWLTIEQTIRWIGLALALSVAALAIHSRWKG